MRNLKSAVVTSILLMGGACARDAASPGGGSAGEGGASGDTGGFSGGAVRMQPGTGPSMGTDAAATLAGGTGGGAGGAGGAVGVGGRGGGTATGGASGGRGGSTSGGAGGAVLADAGVAGAGGGSGVADGGAAITCPTTPPTPSAACAREGLVCQYGEDPRGDTCRPTFTCTAGKWATKLTGCPPLPKPDQCPASRDLAQGKACSPMGAYCGYGDLSCLCTSCPPNAPVCQTLPPQWFCTAPQMTPSCPNAEPNLGTGCASEGATCSYQCDHLTRVCTGGMWIGRPNPGGCPRSSRTVKRDIHYLDDAETRRVADEVLNTRLATWEYKDVALAGKRHLGFIIEDQPQSPAVDRNGQMVDLYGYTSMLLAATKVQAAEIARLRIEIEALKRASARPRPERTPRATPAR